MGEVDAVVIARILEGHSCADLEMVVNEAGIFAGFEGRDVISQQDILRAAMRLLFEGPEHIADTDFEYSKNIAIHEAGHVVIAEVFIREVLTLFLFANMKVRMAVMSVTKRLMNMRKQATCWKK